MKDIRAFIPDPKPVKIEKQAKQATPKLGKRNCLECGIRFQKTQPLQSTCSVKCAIDYGRKQQVKAEEKKWKQRKKEGLEKIKSLADWKKDLQDVVNWIVREIDKDFPCISHPDISNFLRYDAGHAYTVAAHGDIRFNVHNIHKQSSEANERHGFCAEYAEGLKKRYGQEYLDKVLALPLKWKGIAKKRIGIDEIRGVYLPAARQIKRDMQKGATFERDEVNQIIGIYISD